MTDATAHVRLQLARQVEHWTAAADDLVDLTVLASPAAWRSLERYLGTTIEKSLLAAVEHVRRHGDVLRARLRAAETAPELADVHAELVRFRRRYLAVETTLDFYGDAINSRTNARLGAYLCACDYLARESMRPVLEPANVPIPPVLTYVDKGLGASILKAGLRLWDGRVLSPVAAIKVVRHNLQRPTALLHETGHQVAHLVGWTDELAAALQRALAPAPRVAALWRGWASEVAADAFAFVHTGFAALAALHDVIAGERAWVMRVEPLDPHPAGYLRVLLGREMCRRYYGAGPWDGLARAWMQVYPLADKDDETTQLFRASADALPRIVEVVLDRSYRAFGGRSLAEVVDPARVKPEALAELERAAGGALTRSSDWIRREAIRLLALSGLRSATGVERARREVDRQQEWMLRLGELARAA